MGSNNNNKICVSLGSSDPGSLKSLISESLQGKADFIEIRFDYCDDKPGIQEALDTALDQKEIAVFTCRAAGEGGRYSGEEAERVTILRRLASFRPMLLDVEYGTMIANDDLKDQFTALNCDLLVSWHDFEHTPTIEELRVLLGKMGAYSNNVKIVTTAKSMDDSLKTLKLYEDARRSNINLLSFCMGESGVLSRVLCTYAGAPFTYASLTGALAPGQLTLRQMRAIYERLEKQGPELGDYASWKEGKKFDAITEIIEEAKKSV